MNKDIYYIWLSEQRRGRGIEPKAAEALYDDAVNSGIHIVNIEAEEYPDSLRMIDRPPLILYCLGDVSLLRQRSIAVVGTRRASPYGKWIADEICRVIARSSTVHVSGMAEGIDAAGHRAVLSESGKSIAVLGTGIDVCFPKSSSDIYQTLIEKGLVISEYKPGTSGYPSNFPERNRLISGLSEKLVVAEGALKSGSLITARLALEQGKDIYAVPGNINQANSIGPNLLIADGAVPIADPSAIAETLGIGAASESKDKDRLEGLEKSIYEIIGIAGSIRSDELIRTLKAPPEKVLAALSILEITGFIKSDGALISI